MITPNNEQQARALLAKRQDRLRELQQEQSEIKSEINSLVNYIENCYHSKKSQLDV